MSTTQSYLSFSINEIDNRLKEVMINDNEITTLQTYMGLYVKISDLSSYAKVSDLTSYAKVSDLTSYATKADLTSYAKVSDLSYYAKTTDLSYYATKTDLTSYAKVSDLGSYAKTSDLTSYATKVDLTSYAKTTDLSYYATKTDLTSYAKVSDLGSYAKTSDLTSYAKVSDLGSYAKTSDLTSYAKVSDLGSYAKTSDLTSYAKVSDLGSYAKTSDLTPYATISYVNSSILTSYNLSGISLSHVDSVYTLMQGTNKIGDINVPKDLVVQSGEIVKDPEGMAAGTYIKLTLTATEATPIYINVQDLVNVYHAKTLSEGDTDGVQVTISETNEISARISGNINADKVQLYNDSINTYLFLPEAFNNIYDSMARFDYDMRELNAYVNHVVWTLQTYVDTLQVETGYLQTYVDTLQVETGYLQTYVDTAKSNITTLNADVNTVGSVDYKVHASAYTTSYDFNVLLSALTYRVTYLESLVIK